MAGFLCRSSSCWLVQVWVHQHWLSIVGKLLFMTFVQLVWFMLIDILLCHLELLVCLENASLCGVIVDDNSKFWGIRWCESWFIFFKLSSCLMVKLIFHWILSSILDLLIGRVNLRKTEQGLWPMDDICRVWFV